MNNQIYGHESRSGCEVKGFDLSHIRRIKDKVRRQQMKEK